MRLLTIGAAAVTLALCVGEASAQPEIITQTVNVYEAIVTYPGPIWYAGGNPLDQSEHYRKQAGAEFVLEAIPKGQSFESWTSLYAVRGYYVAARPDLTLEQFVGANLLTPYERSCGRENIAVRTLERQSDRLTLIFICQNSAGGPAAIGYRDGIGELAVYKAFKVKTTFVEVFQKWRGPRFVATDDSTWPAAAQDVRRVAELFHKVSAFPGRPKP